MQVEPAVPGSYFHAPNPDSGTTEGKQTHLYMEVLWERTLEWRKQLPAGLSCQGVEYPGRIPSDDYKYEHGEPRGRTWLQLACLSCQQRQLSEFIAIVYLCFWIFFCSSFFRRNNLIRWLKTFIVFMPSICHSIMSWRGPHGVYLTCVLLAQLHKLCTFPGHSPVLPLKWYLIVFYTGSTLGKGSEKRVFFPNVSLSVCIWVTEGQLLNESNRYIFGGCLPLPAPRQSLDGIILFIQATGRGGREIYWFILRHCLG